MAALISIEEIARELAADGPVSIAAVHAAALSRGRRIPSTTVSTVLNRQVQRGRMRWLGDDRYAMPEEAHP